MDFHCTNKLLQKFNYTIPRWKQHTSSSSQCLHRWEGGWSTPDNDSSLSFLQK